jgi:ABC-type glutathione transport system ATPase component/ABC-type dipeptide/oligopeptide/nickel transport system permease subunit
MTDDEAAARRPGEESLLARAADQLRTPAGQREWFTIVGGVGILLFLFVGIFGPMLAPYPGERLVGDPFEPPSAEHLLGTDDVGHDIFSILLIGARVSLFVGLVAGTVAVLVGTAVGVAAGVLGGKFETVLMRIIDVVLTIPFLPLIIVVAAVFGPGLWTTIGVLSAVMWARPARELRSEVLSVREREYIEASRAMGASVLHISVRYVFPAVLLIVIAQYARAVSMSILLEAALSFLGLGDPTRHTWGTILFWAQQRSAFLTDAWKWWVIPPGLAITFSVLSFIFVTLGIERRSGADRRSIATEVPGADVDVVTTDRGPVAPGGEVTADGGATVDSTPVLEVSDLTVEYGESGTVAVDDVAVELRRDELLGVVGESGSGKSSFALALLDLLRSPGRVTDGRVVLYTDREYDRDVELADVRGDVISFVPQEAMNALNPRVRLLDQVVEAVRIHRSVGRDEAERRAREALASVGLPPESYDRFPFELSGGMRQRGVIATALVNDPSVMVVDEPTTGLDVVTKVEVLELLEEIQAERDLSVVVISHDLAAVTRVADRIAVMHEGWFVEVGETDRLRTDPDHAYTRKLLASMTPMPTPEDRETSTPADVEPHLVYDGVEKSFGDDRVLDGVDLTVGRGRSVALLGESGAGKSTLGRMALGLIAPDEGTIRLDGEAVGDWRRRDRRSLGRAIHYVFQDPYSSLAPNRPVERLVREPLDIHEIGDEVGRTVRVRVALDDVGLPPEKYARRYASELSGGERQRVAFARALVHEPSVLIADEPTSMLDAPLQRDLLETMYDLVRERGITLLHVTHDVAQAATYADEIAVLHEGEIVERAPVASILRSPEHVQTRTLVEAAATLAGNAALQADAPVANGGEDEVASSSDASAADGEERE